MRHADKAITVEKLPGCPECASLRLKHADASATHAELRDQLRRAVQGGKGELVTALIVSEVAAMKERDAAEVALRRHEAVAHGGGDARVEAV